MSNTLTSVGHLDLRPLTGATPAEVARAEAHRRLYEQPPEYKDTEAGPSRKRPPQPNRPWWLPVEGVAPPADDKPVSL